MSAHNSTSRLPVSGGKRTANTTIDQIDLSDQSTFYDRIWAVGHVWNPAVWPEWSIIAPLLPDCPDRLEIGAGLRPRLPVRGTLFVDISLVALAQLSKQGGRTFRAYAGALPFADSTFDLIAACEVIEHLECDTEALAEIGRVTRRGGFLLLSVPLDPARWTAHDTAVGHFRRYEPAALAALIESGGFDIIGFCPQLAGGYGGFKRWGAWLFQRAPRLATWIEDRLTLPLGVRLQRSVRRMLPTLPADTNAPGGFVLCRKQSEPAFKKASARLNHKSNLATFDVQ